MEDARYKHSLSITNGASISVYAYKEEVMIHLYVVGEHGTGSSSIRISKIEHGRALQDAIAKAANLAWSLTEED